jgi:hypothetical protein
MRLLETVYQESAPRIDSEAGILYGVKLLGENSRNGRRYTPEAMRNAVPLYEGRKSFVDHPERDKISEDRKFGDWSGVFRNVRYVEGKGIFADQHLRKSGEHFQGILEAAQQFPNAVGYSHVAEGESKVEGNTEIVESIKEVFSVDLVTDPATTAGFFESHTPRTVKQALESLPDTPTRTRLIEMVDGGYLDGSFSANNADPLQSVVLALVDALTKALENLSMKAHEAPPHEAPVLPPPEDDAAAPDDQMPAAMEALRRENAELKAKGLLLESGREATPVRIKALAACTDEDREALLESWPLLEGEDESRPQRSPAKYVESDETVTPESIRERFAAIIG